jgi:hypothetical protein
VAALVGDTLHALGGEPNTHYAWPAPEPGAGAAALAALLALRWSTPRSKLP